MDVNTERQRLRYALGAQGYARVAVEKLAPAGSVDLTDPRVPAQLDEALRAATNAADWTALGHQFALLRQMGDRHFDDVYLRARQNVLNLVVVARFGTSPLLEEWLRPAFDYAWPIVENSEPLLESFTLPPAIQDAGKLLVSAYLGAADPITQAAASLLNAALTAAVVAAGPQCAFVAICEAGFTPALASRVDAWKFFSRKSEFRLNPPYMAGFLWDPRTNEVRGKDERGGGTLSPTQLRQSLVGQ